MNFDKEPKSEKNEGGRERQWCVCVYVTRGGGGW